MPGARAAAPLHAKGDPDGIVGPRGCNLKAHNLRGWTGTGGRVGCVPATANR